MSLSTTLLASSRSPDSSACVAPAIASPTRAKICTIWGRNSSSAVATSGSSSSGSERFPNSRFMVQRLPPRHSTYLGWKCLDERDEMVAVISAVVGLALGVAVTWTLSMKRSQTLREDASARRSRPQSPRLATAGSAATTRSPACGPRDRDDAVGRHVQGALRPRPSMKRCDASVSPKR